MTKAALAALDEVRLPPGRQPNFPVACSPSEDIAWPCEQLEAHVKRGLAAL